MKNFELMALLAEMPAGAEVRVDRLCGRAELEDSDEGLKVVTFSVKDAELFDKETIMLS